MGEGERGSEVESPIKSMVACLELNRATRPLRCQNKASGSERWVSEVVTSVAWAQQVASEA